ncbi:uncharacterized protein FA14DRAFT_162386 [Meira miltonrushii]|uniref:PQ-loop-domain-containing protein n=1 Tax=Meira miltonrushii TaxID=1280837 RepID=A0A316V6N3_9BASI|nr:uncharacterized protein FA14DRAFT_162386 [Meira miltonrushii]PWN32151.1 hypothetical protein FA14DRAFT_162386 [Meira miltonrushii]
MATTAWAAMVAMVNLSGDQIPKECKSEHSKIQTGLSLFLCMGLVISYLPQLFRIILKRSSIGFSPWFLFLGATSSASSFLNVVTLQWPTVSCCQYLTLGACAESLLGIVQVGLQWLLFMSVALLFLVYYPKEFRYERMVSLEGPERGILATYDAEDDDASSGADLDSIDSHIAENYGREGASDVAGIDGAGISGVTAQTDDSAGESALASRLDLNSDDERSSSAFSRLVPTFWPVWKAPRKVNPSPLGKVAATETLPPNATPAAVSAAAAQSSQEAPIPQEEVQVDQHGRRFIPDGDSAHVRIHAPQALRKPPRKRRIKTRSPEWSLALSLGWIVAFHFVFILLVTLLLVSSLPPSSFPSPPSKAPSTQIFGPSSRLLVNRWAAFLGWSAMLLAAFQYLPQIVYTARNKLVGSLSIPMMCLQVPGAVLFIYTLSLQPGVNITSLAAYVCTAVLQTILLGLCVAWRIRQGRMGIDDFGRPVQVAAGRAASEAPSG